MLARLKGEGFKGLRVEGLKGLVLRGLGSLLLGFRVRVTGIETEGLGVYRSSRPS